MAYELININDNLSIKDGNKYIPLDLNNAEFSDYVSKVDAGQVADVLPEGKLQELKDARAAEIAAQGGL